MIPREILKKIRQIELRTNRIVTATLAGWSFQPSPQLGRKDQFVLLPALTCVLSPKRGFQLVTLSASPAVHPTNPVARIFQDAAGVSPSPWGEGRDEGGQNCLNLTIRRTKIVSCCNIMSCNHRARAWAGLADDRERVAGHPVAVADDTASIADDTDAFADDADTVADDTDTVADNANAVAGDPVTDANDPVAIASDAGKIAAGADIFADDMDGFADDAGGVANVRCRNAGAKFFSAQSVFSARNHPNPFSLS
jgi:hypothetical protein